MENDGSRVKKTSFADYCFGAFISLIFLPSGLVGFYIAITDVTAREPALFITFSFCILCGLYPIFSKQFDTVLRGIFSFISAPVRRFHKKTFPDGFWKNKYVIALGMLLFAGLMGSNVFNEKTEVWEKLTAVCMAAGFMWGSLFQVFPQIAEKVLKFLFLILKILAGLVAIIVGLIFAYYAFTWLSSLGAIPISIIVGALIIASAINSNK